MMSRTCGQVERICSTIRRNSNKLIAAALMFDNRGRAHKTLRKRCTATYNSGVHSAVEESPFLRPVQRIIGGIQIQNDRIFWWPVWLHKQIKSTSRRPTAPCDSGSFRTFWRAVLVPKPSNSNGGCESDATVSPAERRTQLRTATKPG
jgi:hypothetical protein